MQMDCHKPIRKNVSFNKLVDVKEFDKEENSTQIHTVAKQKIKEINGLSFVSFIVDNIVYNYFNVQNIKTVSDVGNSLNKSFDIFVSLNPDTNYVLRKKFIICVKNMIQLTCDKISEIVSHDSHDSHDSHGISIICKGGGRGMQVCDIHIPHMKKLTNLLSDFIDSIE